MTQQSSDMVKLLRFPLIFMVLVWHSGFTVEDSGRFPIYEFVTTFFGGVVVRCSVPMFFIISGYLFFINVNEFSVKTYKNKLYSRVRSLFIPYVAWQTILIGVYIVTY